MPDAQLHQSALALRYCTSLLSSYQLVAAANIALIVSEGLLGLNCEFCAAFLDHAQRIRQFQRTQRPACAAAACSVGLVHLSDEWTASSTWCLPP
jgi:hypothetical protein